MLDIKNIYVELTTKIENLKSKLSLIIPSGASADNKLVTADQIPGQHTVTLTVPGSVETTSDLLSFIYDNIDPAFITGSTKIRIISKLSAASQRDIDESYYISSLRSLTDSGTVINFALEKTTGASILQVVLSLSSTGGHCVDAQITDEAVTFGTWDLCDPVVPHTIIITY